MAARRYEISLRVLKNISLVRCAHSWNIFSTREGKFRTSARPCNILYFLRPHSPLQPLAIFPAHISLCRPPQSEHLEQATIKVIDWTMTYEKWILTVCGLAWCLTMSLSNPKRLWMVVPSPQFTYMTFIYPQLQSKIRATFWVYGCN